MKRPLIGVLPDIAAIRRNVRYRLDHRYVAGVEAAGARVLILPLADSAAEARRALEGIDGLLLTGGDDIRARRWGEANHPKADPMHPWRERSDFWMAEESDRRGLPTLGICLGAQLINVARGGSLVQHLPRHRLLRRHGVAVEERTRLGKLLGVTRARVNSHHHQGIGRLGRGLVVTARAEDGVIEAVEDPKAHFRIGVQWHPERMGGGVLARRLFGAFVRAT